MMAHCKNPDCLHPTFEREERETGGKPREYCSTKCKAIARSKRRSEKRAKERDIQVNELRVQWKSYPAHVVERLERILRYAGPKVARLATEIVVLCQPSLPSANDR